MFFIILGTISYVCLFTGCEKEEDFKLEFGARFSEINEEGIENVIRSSSFVVDKLVAERNDDFFPASIITDNMILQRNAVNHIWGKAEFEGNFAIQYDNETYYGLAEDGKFDIYLPPHKEGGPYNLVLYNSIGKYTIKNVMFGEVFLCAGQSNMDWTIGMTMQLGKQDLKQEWRQDDEISYLPTIQNDPDTYYEYYIDDSVKQEYRDRCKSHIEKNKNIRLYLPSYGVSTEELAASDEPVDELNCKWEEANDLSIYKSSMFAYYFAKQFEELTSIPTGIIVCAYGSTYTSTWTPKDIVDDNSDIFLYQGMNNTYNGVGKCYNRFLSSVLPYTVKSIIWYQGCGQTEKYSESLVKMIEVWRNKMLLKNNNLLIVNIVRYGVGGETPNGITKDQYGLGEKDVGLVNSLYFKVRQEHIKAANNIYNACCVVSIDQGDYDDIHPSDKWELAYHALGEYVTKFYGINKIMSGPVVNSIRLENGNAIILFNNVGETIVVNNNGINFEVSCDGINFVEVRAKLYSGNEIIIERPNSIQEINYVRYGALDYPRLSRLDMSKYVSIYNSEGFPLDQFLIKIEK